MHRDIMTSPSKDVIQLGPGLYPGIYPMREEFFQWEEYSCRKILLTGRILPNRVESTLALAQRPALTQARDRDRDDSRDLDGRDADADVDV